MTEPWPPYNPSPVEEALELLKKWRSDTPMYGGEDPRAVHYRRNLGALDAAILALEKIRDGQ